jgi:hypothetical protein
VDSSPPLGPAAATAPIGFHGHHELLPYTTVNTHGAVLHTTPLVGTLPFSALGLGTGMNTTTAGQSALGFMPSSKGTRDWRGLLRSALKGAILASHQHTDHGRQTQVSCVFAVTLLCNLKMVPQLVIVHVPQRIESVLTGSPDEIRPHYNLLVVLCFAAARFEFMTGHAPEMTPAGFPVHRDSQLVSCHHV